VECPSRHSLEWCLSRVVIIWWEGEPVQTRWKELRQFLVVSAIRQLTVMVASAAGHCLKIHLWKPKKAWLALPC